jgi:hypothetical protein
MYQSMLTAHRANDAVAALSFSLLGTTSKAGCPSTVAGIQLNPATTRPSTAKNRWLCDARKVSMPVT